MDKKTKTWLSIALGIILIVGLLGMAAVGGLVYFVYSHVQSEPISTAAATDRFAEARKRFSGRQPLVELREDGDPIVHRPNTSVGPESPPLRTLRVLVHDADDGRVTDVSIPFWLVRLAPGGRVSINQEHVRLDSDDLRVTVNDLERYGPGLIVDHADLQSGTRFLVWTE